MQTIWTMSPLLVRIPSRYLRNNSVRLRLMISDQFPTLSSLSYISHTYLPLKETMAATEDMVAAVAESSENPSHPLGSGRDISFSQSTSFLLKYIVN